MEQLLLIAWRQAELDACKAEHAAAVAGSHASMLRLEARRLREEADRQFFDLLASAGHRAPPEAPGIALAPGPQAELRGS